MRKYILFSLFLVFIGQSFAQKKFSGGLYFAPGISWLSPENTKFASNTSIGMSWKIGGELDINANDNFAFCIAAQYGQNRGEVTFVDSIPDFNIKDETTKGLPKGTKIFYKLNYFDIPAFLKFKTNEIGYITYILKAGGSIGISLTPRANIDYTSVGTAVSLPDAIVPDEVFPIRGGVIIGGGIEYNFGANAKLLVELNYNRDVISMNRTETYNTSTGTISNPLIRLNVLELKVGVLF